MIDYRALQIILKKMPVLVIIDNGHGKDTAGKRSPLNLGMPVLMEWEFNRTIARLYKGMLTSLGIESVLLVPQDDDIPLSMRCEIANKITETYTKKGYFVFLVSIHGNAGGGTGWEVFTSVGETQADAIATTFFNTAAQAWKNLRCGRMRKDMSDGDADKESQFYILKHTTAPAILTENFFYDHPTDLDFMRSSSGVNQIASVHGEATCHYIIQHFKSIQK